MADETIVVVGAGLTAAKAVEALRETGNENRVVLIGDEPHRPYERPPLSKAYLRGERDDAPWVHDAGWYDEHNVELLTGHRVTAIDPDESRVVVDGADPVPWDRLLFATGAEPRRIGIPGHDLTGVHYLRTLESSDSLGAAIQGGSARVVVVGAGWIGSEVAASARQKGCEVTVIEPAEVPLERVLGKQMGGIYRDVHLDQGVQMMLGTGVEAFEGSERVERVRTSDGRTVEADLVVVGIGVIPRTSLAEEMGVACENGILTNASLQTNVPGVYAAGDVANAYHPFYERRIRVEHWNNAMKQGPAAGRALAGEEVSYDEIPYFFSDQYDVGMEYVGYASGEDEVVIRGDTDAREFIAFWLQDNRIAAGMNVNIWDVSDPIKELIKARVEVDRKALADPDTDLTSLLS
ncbi:MAG: FAD-dependent oxidoreductase [Solirubrobacterales bacterium]|nr:FAD-dependent oxidoreductase [Solirubrobacterales bacterium]